MASSSPSNPPPTTCHSFILSFHLLDNTISIWEVRVPNSGQEGGMYLERVKVKKPAGVPGSSSSSSREELYTDVDMQVGSGR